MLNLVVYLALVWTTGQYGAFSTATLEIWGGNYGADVANGQWWRLITHAFLHANLLHIGVNMWVLWSVGRLTEKLYGSFVFLLLYLAAAVTGGLFSIAWDPAVLTVGASGAIFGILGALLASLWRGRVQMPRTIFLRHWLPTLLFCLFSIVNGLFQTGIDNAAHVGGLIAGLLLGFGLRRPLESEKLPLPGASAAIALGCAALFAGSLVWFVTDTPQTPVDRYLTARKWYDTGETQNLMLWQQLAAQAGAGTISGSDLSHQFMERIVPFWRMASARLNSEAAGVPADQRLFDMLFRNFVEIRRQWAQTLVISSISSDPADSQKAMNLMQQADTAAAAVERLEMRSNMEHRSHALRSVAPVAAIANLIWYDHSTCVEQPSGMNPVSPMDAPDDGPAIAHALGCRAQRLFLTRDFAGLEALVAGHQAKLDDLPDGKSSLEAVMGGLDDLLSSGGLTIEQMMDRTTAWRLAYPGSLYPEIAEATALVDWAYYARGFGYANTVSSQNLQLFLHRLAMADFALKSIAVRGASSPLWYEQALTIGLLQSNDKDALRAIFDRGIARFPDHLALYASMLHILMPRWLGSPADIGMFIEDQARKAPDAAQADQRYASLFLAYSTKEEDQVNIFLETGARWKTMRSGLEGLIARYPHSDFYGNVLVKFACEWADWNEYHQLRRHYPVRYLASAWSNRFSLERCDKAARASGG